MAGQIASTILAQLGNRTLFMIGAKNFIENGNKRGVTMKIASPQYNYLKIELDAMDTYTMSFTKIHGGKKVRGVIKQGIYNDRLHSTIREVTKLATNL